MVEFLLYFLAVLQDRGGVIVECYVLLKVIGESSLGIHQQGFLSLKEEMVVFDEVLCNSGAVFFVEILTNYILVVGEGVGSNIFVEINTVESHLQQKDVLTCFMRKGPSDTKNGMLTFPQHAHDQQHIELQVGEEVFFFLDEGGGAGVRDEIIYVDMHSAIERVLLYSYLVYLSYIVLDLGQTIVIGNFSKLRPGELGRIDDDLMLILQELRLKLLLQMLIEHSVLSMVVGEIGRQREISNGEERVIALNADQKLQELNQLLLSTLLEEIIPKLNYHLPCAAL